MELNKHILEDLELVETIDPSANSMYFHAFKPETIFEIEYLQSKKSGKKMNQWTNTQVNKVNVVLPKSTLSDFFN